MPGASPEFLYGRGKKFYQKIIYKNFGKNLFKINIKFALKIQKTFKKIKVKFENIRNIFGNFIKKFLKVIKIL